MILLFAISNQATVNWEADADYVIESIIYEMSAAGQACVSNDPSLVATSLGSTIVRDNIISHYRSSANQLTFQAKINDFPVHAGDVISVRTEISAVISLLMNQLISDI